MSADPPKSPRSPDLRAASGRAPNAKGAAAPALREGAPDAREHRIIGTAGHIDHGKTSLIRALTGVDLDASPEEKARGITISLGFTHKRLPSGRQASFIDVPGHERLVRTMIAGATGLDAVMLCVSAVEGVMPQTREHLAILGLLGIERGLVALTMTDLADPDTLALARMDVEEAVAGTFLEGAPILETSAGPEPTGLDALLLALDDLAPRAAAQEGPFRLPVDRAFVRRGFGTVVTGTARSGALSDGEEVEVLPAGIRCRVRGIQVHGERWSGTRAGLRTALNLSGVERDDLERGMVVVRPGSLVAGSVVDARYQHLPGAPLLEDGDRVRILVGTAEEMAVVTVIGLEGDRAEEAADPGALAVFGGEVAWLQLRLDGPIVTLPGDRFVLRRESPVETLGGGLILDPWAPRARRRDRLATREALRALHGGDRMVLLERAGDAGLDAAGLVARQVRGGVELGDRHLHPARVRLLEATLLAALSAWHRARPLLPGAPRRELHGAELPQLSERAFDALVAGLAASGQVALEGPRLRLPDFQVTLDAGQRARTAAIEAELQAAGLEGPKAGELLAREPDLVFLLLEAGTAVRVGEHILHAAALTGLEAAVLAFFAGHEELSPVDFKELTGLSRKHAIPLLEWLDARRITLRRGDGRVRFVLS